MQLEPLPSETRMLETAADGARLDYFLLRSYETDEIWGLKSGGQWFTRPLTNALPGIAAGSLLLPLWPYRKMAAEAALDIWPDCHVAGISLEHFLEKELPALLAQGFFVDVIPRGENPGCVLGLASLASIFEGMMDAGEYRLDG